MEYSEFFRPQRFFRTFGIWNIPNKNCNNKIIQNIGIWNIPGILKKKWYTTKRLQNFGVWNIPWNIPGIFQKIYHNARGRKV